MSHHKKKKALSALKSDLHAITPIPIELIENRLYALNDDSRIRVYTNLKADESLAFELHHLEGNNINARVYGQLMRWQGTYTRVDATSRTHISGDWMNYLAYILQFLVIIIAVMIVLGLMWGALLTVIDNRDNFPYGLNGIMSAIITLMLMRYLMPTPDLFRDEHYQAAQDVDMLMQELANALTDPAPDAAPILEFDGTEDSLERLLQHGAGRKVALGLDGELQ